LHSFEEDQQTDVQIASVEAHILTPGHFPLWPFPWRLARSPQRAVRKVAGMERAGSVLRRSSVKLRSSLGASSGHADLQMVLSQLKDVRQTQKALAQSEAAAWQDLTKWSLREDNRAIQDAVCQVGELFQCWSEAQRSLEEASRDFRLQFEVILEGERGLDGARMAAEAAEAKETRARKELKRAAKRRASRSELGDMQARLESAERERDLTLAELVERQREHEYAKTVRVREGLARLSQSYVDAAQKCETLMSAGNFIAQQIPATDDVKYTGSGAAARAVATAKHKVKNFRRTRRSFVVDPCAQYVPPPPWGAPANQRRSEGSGRRGSSPPALPYADDLPPPYSEQPPANAAFLDQVEGEEDDAQRPPSFPQVMVGGAAGLSPPPAAAAAGFGGALAADEDLGLRLKACHLEPE